MNTQPDPVASQATSVDQASEQHHGDLRKGAYLKRRAAYQLQAQASNILQADSLPTGRDSPQAGDKNT